jgi:hypothetical protein
MYFQVKNILKNTHYYIYKYIANHIWWSEINKGCKQSISFAL